MEEGYFDYAYFSRCNEGCGGGAEAIEDAGYGLAGPEFVEDGVDGGDDEDGRDGEGDDGCDAAQDAGGEVAGVGGHVDAQGVKCNEKAYIEKCRIYVSGQNLFTIKSKNFSGVDPENAGFGYPIPTTFTVGINIGF